MELKKKTLRAIILGAMGCIVLYWILNETERVKAVADYAFRLIQPFLVGACIAFILNVPMRAIERLLKGIRNERGRRAIAILLTFLAMGLVVTGVVCLLIPQIEETALSIVQQMPAFFSRVEQMVKAFIGQDPQFVQWLQDNTDLENLNWAMLVEQSVDLAGNSVKKIFGGVVSAVGTVANGTLDAIFGIAFALYALASKETLARQGRKLLYAFLPESAADQTVRILRLTNSTFSNFISGQCLECIILGTMIAVSMLIFRMPYIPLISVLIAVTALVPLVGPFLGCMISAFFILVNDPMQAVWFLVMFLVIQQIEGNVIYPRVVGTSIGLPSMWVLVAVSIGGDMMGVAGMLLMIPLASVVYAIVREYTGKRLESRQIDQEKLTNHPPELTSKFREKHVQAKRRRQARKAERLAEMMKKTLHIPEKEEQE